MRQEARLFLGFASQAGYVAFPGERERAGSRGKEVEDGGHGIVFREDA